VPGRTARAPSVKCAPAVPRPGAGLARGPEVRTPPAAVRGTREIDANLKRKFNTLPPLIKHRG